MPPGLSNNCLARPRGETARSAGARTLPLRVLRLVLFGAVCALAAPALLPPSTASAQSREERIARARALFEQGVAAYERNELHVAADKLLAAQRAWRSPQIAFNIARCFERMGEAPRAVHWFRAYLEHGSPTDAERRDVERRIRGMEELQARVEAQSRQRTATQAELTAEARRLFTHGMRYYERGEFRTAYELFQNACAMHQRASAESAGECLVPDLNYNLARAAERLELWGEARLWYRAYLRSRPSAPDRREVEARMRELSERR